MSLELNLDEEEEVKLFPDESWIAIVCGVSKDWAKEDGEELPENFFVAPKDVYMPDLTAVADVLLGKLVSICAVCCISTELTRDGRVMEQYLSA